MRQTGSIPSRREMVISWAVMAILAAAALGVFLKQRHYDPTILFPKQVHAPETVQGPIGSVVPSGLSEFMPPTMAPMNAPETFSPENLSDKINGKAELYLPAGFIGLTSQRFALKGDPKAWMEVYVYDMASLPQAFAVFSMQRRADATPADLTAFSYQTTNALFFVHGRYYVEIIASTASQDLIESMRSFGKRFVEDTPVARKELEALHLFPKDNLEETTISLFISDAFGFDGMKNVFTGRYRLDEQELTAFFTRTGSSEEASKLVEAYQDFLVTIGGDHVPLQTELKNAVLIKIFDTYELFFPIGPFVAGVHEAETRHGAERLAAMLSKSIAEFLE